MEYQIEVGLEMPSGNPVGPFGNNNHMTKTLRPHPRRVHWDELGIDDTMRVFNGNGDLSDTSASVYCGLKRFLISYDLNWTFIIKQSKTDNEIRVYRLT